MSAITIGRSLSQPAQPWRTGADLLHVHGDYGSVTDSRGWAQFSPFFLTFLDGWNRAYADEWAKNWNDRGYTHIALGRNYDYPGSPIPGRDFTPAQFCGYVRQVLDMGFSPICFLAADTPEQPILETTQALKDAGLLPYVICVPAWEPIPTSYWTSKQLSDVLEGMHAIGGDDIVIGVHLQPGRWSMSSHPLEADDPWHGGEQDCWKSHGGQYVDIFLYQFEHGFTQTTAPDWQNRWRDGVPRMGNGLNGWRVMPVCAFETVLYDSYRGNCNETRAREIAGEARDIAMKEFGVSVTFGNGCPFVE